jgi:hypothetical protein
MEKIHPSQEDFSDRGPEQGTPEFEEAKKEAGTGNWFEVFKRNVELAQGKKDRVLLENSVRSMEGDLSDVVAQAMGKGDITAARSALNELEGFAKEQKLDIKEILESQKERVAQEQLDELEKMGVKGVMEIARELFHTEESFNEEDGAIIFKLAKNLVKNEVYETVQDAIIDATIKRWEARPRKRETNLFVSVDRTDFMVGGAGRTPMGAAKKFRENA